MKINFTNIILFFILLVVCLLLISYYGFFGKWEYFSQEGFISFKVDKNPLVGDIVIPTYSPSSRVYKLYDNLFFDNTNGNLIQANGKPAKQDNTDVIDNDGTSLSSIVVYNRDSSIQSVTINTELSEDLISNSASQQSKKTGYDVSFSQFIISNLNGNTTDNYQTLYVAWGKRTFIDVINTSVSPPKTLLGALFTDTKLQGHLVPEPFIPADDAKIKIVPSEYIDDANDGRLNTQSWYENKKLFQVCSFLHYDISNGNIMIINNDKSEKLLRNRQFQQIPIVGGVIQGGISNTLPSVEYVIHSIQYDPSLKQGEVNNNPKFFIYYVGFGKRSILIVLRKQSQTNDMFKIVKVARFDNNGYVQPTSSTRVEPSVPVQSENTRVEYDVSGTDTVLFGIDILLAQQIDYIQENYVKKTDMVAPIYPTVLSCPSCSGSNDGVCNNCGGNGGSGTKGTKDKDEKDTVSDVKDGVVGFGNNIVGGAVDLGKSTLDLGKQAVAGTVDLGKETVGGAVDLTKQGVSGAASMADRAVTGTVNIADRAVTGTVDLGKETVGGAVDLTKQAASGAINQLNYMTTIRGGNGGQGTGYGGQGTGYGGQGTGYGGQGTAYNGGPGTASNGGQRGVPINYNTSGTVPGVDNYSGYGALVNKGQDFMPLTASFSAFGK